VKNIQIIDSAINTAYAIYAIPDRAFKKLFPAPGQDIEFLEDVVKRLGEKQSGELIRYTWTPRQEKSKVRGIHETLFIDMKKRKVYYPNKRESDLYDTKTQKKIRGIP
jgi:hypothetical protein